MWDPAHLEDVAPTPETHYQARETWRLHWSAMLLCLRALSSKLQARPFADRALILYGKPVINGILAEYMTA